MVKRYLSLYQAWKKHFQGTDLVFSPLYDGALIASLKGLGAQLESYQHDLSVLSDLSDVVKLSDELTFSVLQSKASATDTCLHSA